MEVGEYCRDLYSGEILKIEAVWEEDDRIGIKFKEYAGSNTFSRHDLKRFKHSKNIIDLIEVGDYVNGYMVNGKSDDKVLVNYICVSEYFSPEALTIPKELITSIVTKEMFNSVKYEVE